MSSPRRATGLVLALTLLGGLAATPAEATHSRGKCTQKGHTIAKGDRARVYEVRRDEYTTVMYGCLWSRNRPVELVQGYDDDYVMSDVYHGVRLVGRYVAWAYASTDISCKADCPPGYQATHRSVSVFDLKRERLRSEMADAFSGYLRLNSAGAIAWLEDAGARGQRVHARDANGHRWLDAGRISHFRLRGPTLSWHNDGEPRSAQLR